MDNVTDRLEIGTQVIVTGLAYPHTAVVIHNRHMIGLDGRHWVGVSVSYRPCHEWHVHFERYMLTPVLPA